MYYRNVELYYIILLVCYWLVVILPVLYYYQVTTVRLWGGQACWVMRWAGMAGWWQFFGTVIIDMMIYWYRYATPLNALTSGLMRHSRPGWPRPRLGCRQVPAIRGQQAKPIREGGAAAALMIRKYSTSTEDNTGLSPVSRVYLRRGRSILIIY